MRYGVQREGHNNRLGSVTDNREIEEFVLLL